MPPRRTPFRIAAVQFAFPGNRAAIPLRDPDTGTFSGDTPEWDWAGARQVAAFVGGSSPRVRVTFRRAPGATGSTGIWRIGAPAGDGLAIRERQVRLVFDRDGLSQPVDFRIAAPIPRGIGAFRAHFDWHATDGERSWRLGTTRHHFCHVHAQPLATTSWATTAERATGPHGNPALPWVYRPIMLWTCAWARGRRSPRTICDAIMAGLPRSGLTYAVGAWDVGAMLAAGGGYCGGFYRMFQAMAAAQGVRVERRALHVDWRVEHHGVMRWCAMVVSAPGLGRRYPAELPSVFHDSNRGPDARQPVQRFEVRRYRFWGHPEQIADGHCLNFLRHNGRWYLYDASFGHRAVVLRNFRLPRPSSTHAVPVERQGNFQSAYLDRAVGHMLGSLRHAGTLYRTERPDPDHPQFNSATTRNGLSVKTAIIPGRWANITFYWT